MGFKYPYFPPVTARVGKVQQVRVQFDQVLREGLNDMEAGTEQVGACLS